MNKRLKKICALLSISAMIATLFVGCKTSTTSKNSNATSKQSDTTSKANNNKNSTPRNETLYFNGQQWGAINDWNPLSSNSNNAMGIGQKDSARTLIYETLYMYNMLDGKMYPLLASGDPVWNDEHTSLTIKINPDAKWWDGTQVTAEDVAYTWDVNVKYQTAAGSDYTNYIESIKAQDSSTVIINAKLKNGKIINQLKVLEYLPKQYVMQKAYMQKVEQRNENDATKIKTDKMEDLVASGPYKPMISNDQKVVFQRYDNYWGKADSMWGKLPEPKYIAHNIYKDNAAGDVAFKAGEVDVSQQFISDIPSMVSGGKISTYLPEAPYNIGATMPTAWFNLEKPGLDQVAVRKAIAMATDYDQIIKTAMSGQSASFKDVPRSIMNTTPGEQALVDQNALKSVQWTGNDIDGAKKLLDEAGIKDTNGDSIREYKGKNLSFKAECPAGWSDWNASLEIVAAAGKAIGIDIQTYFPDANTFYDDLSNQRFDIAMWSPSGAGISNPWTRAFTLMSSSYNSIKTQMVGNFGGYSNPAVDKLLEEIPQITDQAKLKEYYTQLSKFYLTDVPSFSLMYRPELFYTVNESVWTNFPQQGSKSNKGIEIPPYDLTDGYGIAGLYTIQLIK
ncbi:peptide/nickel transport system substrate-binding protein [Clostridium sp. USBA 49]|uniref:ABC transporter substrate-binding protein n=1 Tax=Clostridium sp. USBA 49 TaxID=1881060 RepID=UPI00099ACDD4|nr:ABC transporter substrate-binding protein [Clostridium sp. USBA 49]SKA73818.1 peptide/nickel transport system substrate-binding protein [Clostridium sp. USBA 49]